jgi:hypothetical protein
MLKVGLDIDGCICDFWGAYIKRYGTPKSDYEILKNIHDELKTDYQFWLNLELINKPNFLPVLYCTKRTNSKLWTQEYLDKHGLLYNGKDKIPVYQMFYGNCNKSDMVRNKVDVFVDDNLFNFIEMNLNGVPCLLMNHDCNLEWGPVCRIYTLDIEEIEDTLRLFKDTIKDFKKLI